MRDSFVNQMTETLGSIDHSVLLTGDLGFGIFNEISERFPERFINVGVAEQNMIGVASGMAKLGKAAFCYSIANFVFMRGLEQFRNGPVYHDFNVTLVCSGGGFTYGQLGFTHFAIEDYGIISALGGVEILTPSTSAQVKRHVTECATMPGPKYLRLEKTELDFPELEAFGERLGLVCHRRGGRKAILAVGGLLSVAMEAAEQSDDDIAVYSLPRFRSLSEAAVREQLAKHELIVSLEEHVLPNSAGLNMKAAGLNVIQLAISDNGPSVVGDQNYLRQHYGLTVENVLAQLRP
ncbi:transketolase subunit B [Altererythrobacter xiamenensis]|uniref:Transketolase subunit B n=1 Tax=Altererythrobacter xiamenensis TaxID=1316679 RepID=A0A1Y6F2J9_9SPHN|nr:hypothetical protein [Altererythrobacter xiamenensis]SMQ69075.1 transketolase subunit B [Altererythrobacter xiamenensis]